MMERYQIVKRNRVYLKPSQDAVSHLYIEDLMLGRGRMHIPPQSISFFWL